MKKAQPLDDKMSLLQLEGVKSQLGDQGFLFQAMLEASQDGVAILDESFTLIECNRSFAEMLGYTKEEILGHHAWFWDAQKSKEDIIADFPDLTILNNVFLTKHRRKDGSIFDVEISVSGATVNGITLMVAVCRSITERMLEREALMKTQFAMDHARDNCTWIDGEGRIIYANEAACRSLRYTHDELRRMTIFDIDPVFTREDFEKHKAILKQGQSMLFETLHKDSNGRIFPVEVSSNYFGHDEEFLACAFDRDITVRKNAEQELQESYELLEQRVDERTQQLQREVNRRKKSEKELKRSQAMFKALAESSPDFIYRLDRQYRQIYVNPAIEKFIGQKPEELVGKTFDQIPILNSVADLLKDSLKKIFTQKTSVKIEFQLPNGIWVETLGSPEYNDTGKVVAAMTTSRDITARKKAERELQIVNDFQTLLMELATSFINLPLSEMDVAFQEALRKIGSFVNADRMYILDFTQPMHQCRCTHEWSNSGIPPRLKTNMQHESLCQVQSKIFSNNGREMLHIPDMSKLGADDPLRSALEGSNIKTLVVVPMVDASGSIGCLGIESITVTDAFSEIELQLINLFNQMLLNVKRRKCSEEAISEQHRFQEMVATIATDFIGASRTNVHIRVTKTLERIGELLGLDRTALFLFKPNNISTENILQWCREGVEIRSEILHPHPIVDCSPEQKQRLLKDRKIYHFPSVEDIPESESAWQKAMLALGIKSALFLSVHNDEQIYGMVGFETKTHYFHWSVPQINGLRVIAQILANGIASIEVREKLLDAKSQLEERVLQRTQELEEQIVAREEAMKELAATQSSLLEASRYAGMAEVATNVLHNVGNVLNSVNVSCTLLKDHLKHSRIEFVEKVADMFATHKDNLTEFLTDNPLGRQLPSYLTSLSEALKSEQQTILSEADLLNSRIDHIKEIVAMQQNFGRIYGVNETISAEQLLIDALKLNDEALRRHNVEVRKLFEKVPPLTVDRHKVLQILLNLIRNAKYACDESNVEKKVITLRLHRFDDNFIRIQVADNGIGIATDHLAKIFQHGFTTRHDGHGFGLHSSSLAAKQLGGRLSVASEGPGHGATFTLDLPLQQGEQ